MHTMDIQGIRRNIKAIYWVAADIFFVLVFCHAEKLIGYF